ASLSLSSIPQSQLSQLHDPSGYRDVVCKTHLPVGPGYLAAVAELSPTSQLGLGVVTMVDGTAALICLMATIVCGGRIHGDKKNGGSGGVGASSSAGTKCPQDAQASECILVYEQKYR
ncbi:hypothetical protein Tco_0136990, partial [Tanacetum coccineum]